MQNLQKWHDKVNTVQKDNCLSVNLKDVGKNGNTFLSNKTCKVTDSDIII